MRTLVTLLVTVAAALAPASAAGALASAAPAHGAGGHHVTGVAHVNRAGAPGAKPTVVYRDLNLPTGAVQLLTARRVGRSWWRVQPWPAGSSGRVAAEKISAARR